MPRPSPRLLVFLPLLLLLPGCGEEAAPASGDPPENGGAPGPLHLVDEAIERGLTAVNHTGHPTNKRYLIEETGNGCVLLDFDGDGHLDVYLVDACELAPPEDWSEETREGDWVRVLDGQNKLYRNSGGGRFEDVTEGSGAGLHVFGVGGTAADYDDDGDPDLYVSCWGENHLLRNDGGGKFTDVTAAAGVGDPPWSVGTCWLDADRDGDLELYVVNYVAMTTALDPDCWRKVDCPWYDLVAACGPKGMVAEPDSLYFNEGDGTFTDASEASGIRDVESRYGLGSTAFDFDLDGDVDIYVANDSRGNFLFENDGKGWFSDMAGFLGGDLSRSGLAQAGMGIACGDFDGDLDLDLFLTNFSHDDNTLYQNDRGGFLDVTHRFEFSEQDFFSLSWGTEFVDFDNDSDLDLFISSGHLYPEADRKAPELSYRQLNRIYLNRDARLINVTADCGPGLQKLGPSRGAAFGDVDNDGDIDVLVVEMNQPPTLLVNHTDRAEGGHSLLLSLEGTDDAWDAVGARAIADVGGRRLLRVVRRGDSFASCSDPRLHFGTGSATRVQRLEVTWPNGQQQVVEDLPVDCWLHWRQGDPEPTERQ